MGKKIWSYYVGLACLCLTNGLTLFLQTSNQNVCKGLGAGLQ